MITRQAPPLGPQCLQCKKRRVKCDSAVPTCHKCYKDDFDCPGYYKAPTWSVIVATKTGPREQQPRKRQDRSKQSKVAFRKQEQEAMKIGWAFQVPISQSEKEAWQIEHSVSYWNQNVVRDVVALPMPGEEIGIAPHLWPHAPKVLQHILIVLVANHKLTKHNPDAAVLADLYQHRGQALQQLHKQISRSETLTVELLIGVIAIMTASEIQMCALKGWYTHLEAGKALVDKGGGIKGIWCSTPDLHEACAFYILIDVMSATTTPAYLLPNPNPLLKSTDLLRLDGLDRRLLSSCCPIPLQILEAIAGINELRSSIYQTSQHAPVAVPSTIHTAYSISQTACHILREVLNFNADVWATEICSFYNAARHSTKTTTKTFNDTLRAWISLAKCYQSATLIYFLRSIQSSQLNDNSEQSQAKFASETNQLLEEHIASLSSNLSSLYAFLENHSDVSDELQLWRFVVWPLFIHAYELASQIPYDNDDEGELAKTTHRALRRMHLAGKALGARSLFDAVKLLHQVISNRRRGRLESWDDGFPGRCIFVV